jgi:Co/Zn/Cd efflux system component
LSPALALAVLFVFIGAQVARVLSPRRGAYAWLVVYAIAGLLGAELVCIVLHTGGPMIGVLHPIADVLGMALAETAGLVFTPRRRLVP